MCNFSFTLLDFIAKFSFSDECSNTKIACQEEIVKKKVLITYIACYLLFHKMAYNLFTCKGVTLNKGLVVE